MTDNSKQIIERMQASFPHIYNVYDKSTILYALLSVFGERLGMCTDIIDRLYAMIGIDSTYDEDLEHRWGSLLGIYRQSGESYSDYRSRLLIVYSSLAGGTAEAIKYAIASAIGITDLDTADKYIKVYDAWEYPFGSMFGDVNADNDATFSNALFGNAIFGMTYSGTVYGHIVCTIDTEVNENVITMSSKIEDAVNKSKASGICPHILFLYTAEENTALSYSDYDVINKIGTNLDEQIGIVCNDECVDRIISTIEESDTIASTKPTGLNEMSLNDDFITNTDSNSEIDQHKDIVLHDATFGNAIFDDATFNIQL